MSGVSEPGLGERSGDLAGERTAPVVFVYPFRTLQLSATGPTCPSSCGHCGGYYLKNMHPMPDSLPATTPRGPVTFLVSGGCDGQGRICHLQHTEKLQALARHGSINLHSGLVTEEEAEVLGPLAQVVSFDLVLDGEIIQGVYGFDAAPEDYLRSYRVLKRDTRVVPHLCLGLKGGMIHKERETLDFLQGESPEAVCFLVFTPTPNTALGRCPPPPLQDVASILADARRMLPQTSLHLGCLRPGGRYRAELDELALRAGIDRIVQPAPPVRKRAGQMGLKITRREECCCLC